MVIRIQLAIIDRKGNDIVLLRIAGHIVVKLRSQRVDFDRDVLHRYVQYGRSDSRRSESNISFCIFYHIVCCKYAVRIEIGLAVDFRINAHRFNISNRPGL